MSLRALETQEEVRYYLFLALSCTFFCFFICEAKKQKKGTKEKKENTLIIVGLVDVNRLDKSSNELLDYLYLPSVKRSD